MPVAPGLKEQLASVTQRILDQKRAAGTPMPGMAQSSSGNTGVANKMLTPTSISIPSSNVPMPNMNAATAKPNVPMPSTGFGGGNYGTNAATNRALEANTQYIKDPANRQSEIDRALGVVKAREAQGLDTSAQTKYLDQLGYKPEQRMDAVNTPTPNGTFQYTPPSTQSIPTYSPAIPTLSIEDIRAYAQAQTANKLKDLRTNADNAIQGANTTAEQQLGALQTQFDRQGQDITQDRSVQDVTNARRLNPFSGRSDFTLGMIEQERARTDRQREENLASAQGNINQSLADFTNAQNNSYTNLANQAPDLAESLVQQMRGDERAADLAYAKQAIDTALANGQLSQQDYNQALSTWQTNFNALQQQIQNEAVYGGNYNGNRSLQGQAQDLANKQSNWNAYMDMVNQTGNLGKGPSATWSSLVNNATSGTPTLQGTQVMAQLTGQLPNGQKTTDQQQRDLENLWTGAIQTGTISNQLADLYGVPRGTQTQQAFEFVSNFGLQQDQNDLNWIQEYNRLTGNGNGQQPQYSGMTASQVAGAIRGQIFDEDGALKQGITPDNIWQTVVGYGLPDGQDDQVMMSLGLTKQQIADLDKKYGATGN